MLGKQGPCGTNHNGRTDIIKQNDSVYFLNKPIHQSRQNKNRSNYK